MSRIGKLPIILPAGVEVNINGSDVSVKGPKGNLSYTMPEGVSLKNEEGTLSVSIDSDEKKNLWGLVRTLVNNMVEGVTKGYEKKLHVMGVGYNVKVQGNKMVLSLGYSHPINYDLPEGISATSEKDPKGNDIITLSGIDKQKVGQVAAKIKTFREPEPYKGKGVRYFGEVIKLKAGKTSKK